MNGPTEDDGPDVSDKDKDKIVGEFNGPSANVDAIYDEVRNGGAVPVVPTIVYTALGIDATQLGNVKAADVSTELWQESIPQIYEGMPVRHGRIAAIDSWSSTGPQPNS